MTTTRASSRATGLALLLCLLLAACAAGGEVGDAEDPTETPGSEAAPTEDLDPVSERPTLDDGAASDAGAGSDGGAADDAVADALRLPATGTFGQEDIEGGCAFVEIDGQRYELVADPSAGLAIDPANGVIVTEDGEEVARAGATITVDGQVDAGLMTFCQIGPVLVASEITVE